MHSFMHLSPDSLNLSSCIFVVQKFCCLIAPCPIVLGKVKNYLVYSRRILISYMFVSSFKKKVGQTFLEFENTGKFKYSFQDLTIFVILPALITFASNNAALKERYINIK